MNVKQQKVIIISGPSGVGKGTVIKTLLDDLKELEVTISATTREPRKNEIDKETYYFMSKKDFDTEIENDAFLEWCNVHGNRYGTLHSETDRILTNKRSVLLEIDTNGAAKVRNRLDKVLSIFIAPPSVDILRERLEARHTEDSETIKRRLLRAKSELKAIDQYDYVVINHHLGQAIQDIKTLLKNEGLIT